MKLFTFAAAILVALCTTSCATDSGYDRYGKPRNDGGKENSYALRAPMDPNRRIVEVDCRNSYYTDGGNLRCM